MRLTIQTLTEHVEARLRFTVPKEFNFVVCSKGAKKSCFLRFYVENNLRRDATA
jgi:hypothetical protein